MKKKIVEQQNIQRLNHSIFCFWNELFGFEWIFSNICPTKKYSFRKTKNSCPVKNDYPIDIRIGLELIYIDETILYEVDQKSYQGSSGNTIKITSILQVGV